MRNSYYDVIDFSNLDQISIKAKTNSPILQNSIYPKYKVPDNTCDQCIKYFGKPNACKECNCDDCLGKEPQPQEKEKSSKGCKNCPNKWVLDKNRIEILLHHPCHNKKHCFFAYYKYFTQKNGKYQKPKIHFVQPNLLSAYHKIPKQDRGPNNFLWPIMVTCTFYHELGHHLVELYKNAFRRDRKKPCISYTDEQKLCEILGFGFTLHLLSKSGGVNPPIKYLKTSIRGKRRNSRPDYDIGYSNIYHKLPLYTSKPFTDLFIQKGRNTYGVGTLSSKSAIHSLSLIAAAKGGRGPGEKYEPKPTKSIEQFISFNTDLWDHLFYYLFEPESSDFLNKSILPSINSFYLPKHVLKQIDHYNKNFHPSLGNIIHSRNILLSKDNIKICGIRTKRCDIPLNKVMVNKQNKISYEHENTDIFEHQKKGRILDLLRQLGYTHKEYREIRKDIKKYKRKPKPKGKVVGTAPKKLGIKMF